MKYKTFAWAKLAGLALVLLIITTSWCQDAFAVVNSTIPLGTCTNSQDYAIDPNAYSNNGQGIFTTIQQEISSDLNSVTELMFENIRTSAPIRGAVQAAVTLYIAIYGIAFMFGLVQITVFNFMIRMVKIGIIASLLSLAAGSQGHSQASNDFANTFGNFFNKGTDNIISAMSNVYVGTANNGVASGAPFGYMDQVILYIISPKMAAVLIATFTTGPYGLGIGLLLLMSFGSFLKALLNAMWVYVMALVMRTFMFALAPLFIPCILFERTRNLFDGWLNQIVNSCLQPIFLFAFFNFFTLLMLSCLNILVGNDISVTPVCWTGVPDAFRGTPFEGQFWRFAVWDCTLQKWMPFNGTWDFTGPVGTNCNQQPVHPIGIILPLTLWILSDLAARFNNVVVDIAKDIASSSTDLRMGAEKLTDWMSGGINNEGGLGGGERLTPAQASAGVGIRKGAGGEVAAPPSRTNETMSSTSSAIVNTFKEALSGIRNKPTGRN